MPQNDYNLFESEEYLLQICREHFNYAEKSEVRFDFRNIARVRIYRKKPERTVSKITYRVRGQLSSFQIDGFADSEMERIATILKERAAEFAIPIIDSDLK